MRKQTTFTVFLYGLNALLWTIKAIANVIYQQYSNYELGAVLGIFNALLWNISFFVALKRYRSKEEQ